MFWKKKDRYKIGDEIEMLLIEMSKMDRGGEEYGRAAQTLRVLKDAERMNLIDYNVVATGVITLLQMAGLLYFERFNVLTSKAVGFVWKSRR
jgi:hypothetical protein